LVLAIATFATAAMLSATQHVDQVMTEQQDIGFGQLALVQVHRGVAEAACPLFANDGSRISA